MKKIFLILFIVCLTIAVPAQKQKKYLTETESDAKYPLKINEEPATNNFYLKSSIDTMRLARYTKTQFAYVIAHSLSLGGTPLAAKPAYGTTTDQIATMSAMSDVAKYLGLPVRIFPDPAATYSFPYVNTGNTTENTILTFTIPANSISKNGCFWILAEYTFTTSTNLKSLRIKFNGTQVAIGGNFSLAGTFGRSFWIFSNSGSLATNKSPQATDQKGGAFQMTALATASPAFSTYAINTAADITVTITSQLATGTETLDLQTLKVFAVY